MCGIAGIVNFNHEFLDPFLLEKMTKMIAHRGPDDEGHVLLSSNQKLLSLKPFEFRDHREIGRTFLSGYNIGLGFRRLSIIDLSSAGHQPMSNEDKSVWVIFNGEFYNYFRYINELKQRGHIFNSKTDTEVLIHLYEDYDIDGTLERMNGMFAFALFDAKKRCLILARDRVGIKPLYYYKSKNQLVFASEIKAILEVPGVDRSFDSSKLFELFQNRYINAPDTVFSGIKKVIPGTYWRFNLDTGKGEEINYWSVFDETPTHKEPLEEKYLDSLINSVSYRLRSDVPLGVFLSGGVDSSTICGIISREMNRELKTFSIEFDGESEIDERCASRQVAHFLDTEHHRVAFDSDVFEMLPKIVWHCEEPIADPALLPTYNLCKYTRKHVTVALSGEGSDETNYGYELYRLGMTGRMLLWLRKPLNSHLLSLLSNLPKDNSIARLNSFIHNPISDNDNERFMPGSLFEKFFRRGIYTSSTIRGQWWKKRFKATSLFDVKPLIHFHTWLQDDLLLKVDKMSMAHNLEVRVPYLDHNLIDIAFNIDAKKKIDVSSTKLVLRKISESYIPKIISKRRQHGLLVPLITSFENDLFNKPPKKSYIRDFLEPASDIIDIESVIKTLAPKERLGWGASVQLWLMLMVGLCIDQFRLSIK